MAKLCWWDDPDEVARAVRDLVSAVVNEDRPLNKAGYPVILRTPEMVELDRLAGGGA